MLGLNRTAVQCRAPVQQRAGPRVAVRRSVAVRAVDVEAKAESKTKKGEL